MCAKRKRNVCKKLQFLYCFCTKRVSKNERKIPQKTLGCRKIVVKNFENRIISRVFGYKIWSPAPKKTC